MGGRKRKLTNKPKKVDNSAKKLITSTIINNADLRNDPDQIVSILDCESQQQSDDLHSQGSGIPTLVSNDWLINQNEKNNDDQLSNQLQHESSAEPDNPLDSDFEMELNDLLQVETHSEDEDISEIPASKPAKQPKLNNHGKGKPSDPAWREFTQSVKVATQTLCNHCGESVSKKVERLRRHLKKCPDRPQNKFGVAGAVSRRKSVPASSNSSSNMRQPSYPSLLKYVDKAGKDEINDLKMEAGRYIFANNLPFSHVESPAFVRYTKKLRLAAILPKRQTIGGSILEKTYENVRKEQESSLKGKSVTIMQDGWKTRTTEPVIAHSIRAGKECFFLDAVPTEDKKKTGRYCASLLVSRIQQLNDKGTEVVAVVTDNCKSMEKMRKIIAESYPKMFTYGCHAHLINLVGKKLTDEDLTKKLTVVHTFFRNHDAAWGLLKKEKGTRPKMPSNVRWNAWIDCMIYYITNHTKMLNVSRNSKIVSEEVKEILNDSGFYEDVRKTMDYLKPVQIALDKVQKQGATLADGVREWIKLRDNLVIQTAAEQAYFMKQFNCAMQPVGIGAYMLHPVYRGNGLLQTEKDIGNEFLAKESPMLVIIAAQLKEENDDYFPKEFFTKEVLESCAAEVWWSSQQSQDKITKHVAKFSTKLMQLPAGSADIERHFSTLGNILTVRRMRLGIPKASKLCVIYRHYGNEDVPCDDEVDWISDGD